MVTAEDIGDRVYGLIRLAQSEGEDGKVLAREVLREVAMFVIEQTGEVTDFAEMAREITESLSS